MYLSPLKQLAPGINKSVQECPLDTQEHLWISNLIYSGVELPETGSVFVVIHITVQSLLQSAVHCQRVREQTSYLWEEHIFIAAQLFAFLQYWQRVSLIGMRNVQAGTGGGLIEWNVNLIIYLCTLHCIYRFQLLAGKLFLQLLPWLLSLFCFFRSTNKRYLTFGLTMISTDWITTQNGINTNKWWTLLMVFRVNDILGTSTIPDILPEPL